MKSRPLTIEQQQFAEENHDLIYTFLRSKRLNFDYYYDTVVFGYLRAITKYFNRPELRVYSFKTIAWYAMNTDLHNHYRKQSRKKRTAYVVSLDTMVYIDEPLMMSETVAAPDMNMRLSLDELAELLPSEQFNIVRMKSEGYNNREISKKYNIPLNSIQEILSSVKELIYFSLI